MAAHISAPWQMQQDGVHNGMNHYSQQQESGMSHHHQQAWNHSPGTTMATYAASTMPAYESAISPFHTPPTMRLPHYNMPSSTQFEQHASHQHHLPQPQQYHHQQHHQPSPNGVRHQSSQNSLPSMTSAMASPTNQLPPHSHAMAPMGQPTHAPSNFDQNMMAPMQLSSPPQAARYNQPVPHQVVGQQGIRGVLPRSNGSNSSDDEEDDFEPVQVDGQWPCKFCGKVYRHAKHLRRHYQRHTGDTPYECLLCSRRFGRSDVLKRHYQKCASRRGVTVGDHLAGQRGHPRRSKKVSPKRGKNPKSALSSPTSNGFPEGKGPGPSVPMSGSNMGNIY